MDHEQDTFSERDNSEHCFVLFLKLQEAPGKPKSCLFLCLDARSEDQICQCVRKGDRPAEDILPVDTPTEMIDLMKWSWKSDPLQRPTFKGPTLQIIPNVLIWD